jgi:MFS family permease
MAIVFAFNQVVSHGFGLFLFAAVVPFMQQSTEITFWHIGIAGAATQVAYLLGAFLLGIIGSAVSMRKVSIATGTLAPIILLFISFLSDPLMIIVALVLLALSASMSWGAIVEIVSRHAPDNRRSTYLSSASSGTAWGYGIIGLVIIWLVPILGWEISWRFASVFGLLVLIATILMFKKLGKATSNNEHKVVSVKFSDFLKGTLIQKRALLACTLFFFIGITTMPFSTWLNSYIAELKLPMEMAGVSWTTVGVTGMFAGVILGGFADKYGNSLAILILFLVFGASQIAFNLNPASMLLMACIGYGVMYFPVWGVVAGWLNETFDSLSTMRISGFCMLTFGVGGATGNVIMGLIKENTASLQLGFSLLSYLSLGMILIAIYISRSILINENKLFSS